MCFRAARESKRKALSDHSQIPLRLSSLSEKGDENTNFTGVLEELIGYPGKGQSWISFLMSMMLIISKSNLRTHNWTNIFLLICECIYLFANIAKGLQSKSHLVPHLYYIYCIHYEKWMKRARNIGDLWRVIYSFFCLRFIICYM